MNSFEIFLLELDSVLTSSTMMCFFGGVEENLIDDDRMRVDVTFGQFLDQLFRFVERLQGETHLSQLLVGLILQSKDFLHGSGKGM